MKELLWREKRPCWKPWCVFGVHRILLFSRVFCVNQGNHIHKVSCFGATCSFFKTNQICGSCVCLSFVSASIVTGIEFQRSARTEAEQGKANVRFFASCPQTSVPSWSLLVVLGPVTWCTLGVSFSFFVRNSDQIVRVRFYQ